MRALAHFPGLEASPWHDWRQFRWLADLQDQRRTIAGELRECIGAGAWGSAWEGNDCYRFDEHGWSQIPLASYGRLHPEAHALFPRTLELLRGAPIGPREVSIVRQAGRRGLPRHSDQRNYMLTAHVVLQGAGCTLHCDGEARLWHEGAEPTVIDTTFWHATANESAEPVYVLLVDFWHPGLTPREKRALSAFIDLEGQYLELLPQGSRPAE